MSGFCGFMGFRENSEVIVNAMLGKIKHRGPDGNRVYIKEAIHAGQCDFILNPQVPVSPLGVRCNGMDLVILFDGEIENRAEIMIHLESAASLPEDSSDEGLLIRLYSVHGEEMLSYVQGAFAFVIYDFQKKQLFAARDRLGCKPLYYGFLDGVFCFASEIKGFFGHPDFTPVLNEAALAQYLSFQYSVLPETFFKGIYKLQPAHYLLHKEETTFVERYWEPVFKPVDRPFDEKVADIDKAIVNAMDAYAHYRGQAASFLSGGVDSGFIAARFRPKLCVTVGYENNDYSESVNAAALAGTLGIKHITKEISGDAYFEVLPEAMYYMDEPMADPAAIAFYFGCKAASEHVRIAFSGEGPDEFFGGYGQYFEPFALDKVSFVPEKIRRAVSNGLSKMPMQLKGMGYLIRAGKNVEERFIGNAYMFTEKERSALLKSHTDASPASITQPLYDKVRHLDEVTQMQYIDINLWLAGDILHQADRMGLAHSLLIKTPFLNKKVIDLAMQLPTKYRVTKDKNKIAFRAAAKKYLPRSVAQRKKWGFPVPLRCWLKEDKFYAFTKAHFLSKTARQFFHIEILLELLDAHKQNRADNSRKIWTILMFIIWYKKFFTEVI